MEFITVTEGAALKGCTPQAIRDAINAGKLKAVRVGKTFAITPDRAWKNWKPDRKKQEGGFSRWKQPA